VRLADAGDVVIPGEAQALGREWLPRAGIERCPKHQAAVPGLMPGAGPPHVECRTRGSERVGTSVLRVCVPDDGARHGCGLIARAVKR
jgi:hypothetical protein